MEEHIMKFLKKSVLSRWFNLDHKLSFFFPLISC
ncbi:tryptophanase leader peptide [Mannheimia bovis]|uniref:Tryptophanase leader peptide n=1 Tax=Mannheimia bovis TaxID=2770636 RepID=A0A7H1C3I4_9PAST|nr:tryptophanase leader peptide [Mannheimia bovis]